LKKLFVFDLDEILAESMSSLSPEVAGLLHDLLGVIKVAVISGVSRTQFDRRPVDEFARTSDEAHSAGVSDRRASSNTALTRPFPWRRIRRRTRGWPPSVANVRRPFDSTFLSPWPTTPPQERRAPSFGEPNWKRQAQQFDSGRDVIKLLTSGVRELMDAER